MRTALVAPNRQPFLLMRLTRGLAFEPTANCMHNQTASKRAAAMKLIPEVRGWLTGRSADQSVRLEGLLGRRLVWGTQ